MDTHITQLNNALAKHTKHTKHQRTLSQSYNRREAYEARRADAYIRHLWRTEHTPLVNAVKAQSPSHQPPQHTDYQPPEHPTPPPTPPHTERTAVLVIDRAGQADIYTGTLTRHTLTFTRGGRTYTLHLTPVTDLPALPATITYHNHTYTPDDIYRTAISHPNRVYMLDHCTIK